MTAHGGGFPIDEIKEFYDPHPYFVGAQYGIPREVKEVIDQLNGQSMSLHEAINRIKAVTKHRVGVGVRDNLQEKFITLEVEYDSSYDVKHTFCVIKYR